MIMYRRNDALAANPPEGATELSTGGSDWLWAVTAVFCLSFICLYATSFASRNGEKIFHYLFTIALLAGSIAYYAMASDLGFSVVDTELYRGDAATYQVFFAKYIYWVVSFPTVIIALGLLSGISWATIFFNIAVSWSWILSYLFSAYTKSSYRWGFYVFGTVAYFVLAYETMIHGLSSARRVEVSRDYIVLACWANLLWLLYPIAFALTDAGNVISVVSMSIFFGILDVLMVPCLAFGFVFLSRNWDYGKLNLHFTQYGRVPHTGSFPEKETAPTASGAAVV